MELIFSVLLLLALIPLLSFFRKGAAEVLDRWRARAAERSRVSSELESLEIFLRSEKAVSGEGEWVFKRNGRRGTVTVEPEPGQGFSVAVWLEVDGALDLEIRRPKFSKRLRVAAVDKHIAEAGEEQPDIRFDVKRAQDERGEISERLFSHAGDALTEPLVALLYRLGADAVIAKNGRLGVTLPVKELLLERTRDILRALEAVANAYSRRPQVGGLVERYLWLEGSSPRCPYCHVDLAEGEPGLTACGRCRTVHHEACFAEHGGCTLLGCGGKERAALEPRSA
jgi:hypothetical protein